MDINKTAIVICKIWRFSGLPNYKFENEQFEYYKSKSYVIFSIIVLINITFFITYQDVNSKLNLYMIILQSATLYMLDICFVIYTYVQKENIRTNLNDLLMINKIVCQVSKSSLSVNKISKLLFLYLAIQVSFVTFEWLIVSLITSQNYTFYIRSFCYFTAMFYNYLNLNLFIFFHLLLLRHLYMSLINIIKNPMIINFDLKHIIKISEMIGTVTKNINKSFQVPILLKIVADFILTTADLYYSTKLLFPLYNLPIYVVPIIVIYIINILMSIFMMAYFFEEISEKVSC